MELPAEVWRIVVLGDPHGDLIALEQVLLQESRPDTLVLSAGDNVGYSDGAVSSWGLGGFGFLGHGDEQSQLLPKKIEGRAQ